MAGSLASSSSISSSSRDRLPFVPLREVAFRCSAAACAQGHHRARTIYDQAPTMMTFFSGFLYCLSFNDPASRSYSSSSFARTASTVKVLVVLGQRARLEEEGDNLPQGALLNRLVDNAFGSFPQLVQTRHRHDEQLDVVPSRIA